MNIKPYWTAAIAAALAMGLAGCEREGPMERAGEEIDEAVDTVREGEEPMEHKADDAIDEAREGVNETADEVRDN